MLGCGGAPTERHDRELGVKALAVREAVVQAKHEIVDHEPVLVVPQVVDLPKSDRVVKEKQRPLFFDMPDSPLPPLALLDDAPSAQEMVSAGNARVHVAPDRAQARRLRRRRARAGRVSGSGDHALRDRARGRRQGRADRQPDEGSRARAVGRSRFASSRPFPASRAWASSCRIRKRQIVKLVEILSSATYNDTASPLTLALGKDIAGKAVIADLARMPHLLVAGTTGSGKSVAVNAMILSLLYKAEPRQVRMILVDPKMLELSVYEGIPHLLAPVVTDMKLAGERAQLVRRRDGAPLPADVDAWACATSAATTRRSPKAKKSGKPLAESVLAHARTRRSRSRKCR